MNHEVRTFNELSIDSEKSDNSKLKAHFFVFGSLKAANSKLEMRSNGPNRNCIQPAHLKAFKRFFVLNSISK